jgi:hypothetical protein
VTSTGNPFGSLDGATLTNGQVHVTGWTIDPDTNAPIDAHVYIGGTGFAIGPAAVSRGDVGARYPGYGPQHGFDVTLGPASPGQTVCAYGIDVGPGDNALLGCRQL